jgi:alanine racemase
MPSTDLYTSRLTQVVLYLDRLSHNMHLLQQQVGGIPLWPCIKADAYDMVRRLSPATGE